MLYDECRIHWSKHALKRLEERGISVEEALEALREPVQLVYDSWKDLYVAVHPKGHAVVYAFRGSYVEIVTVLGRREYEALISKHGVRRYKLIS